MGKDSFIFYRSFAEAIDDLPDEEQLKIYKAIKEYALNERETELSGIAKSFWKLIKPQITANNRRYQNGTKGGRLSAEPEPNLNLDGTKPEPNPNLDGTKPEPNPNLDGTKPEPNPNLDGTKPEPNENENENENVNVNDNDNDNEKFKRDFSSSAFQDFQTGDPPEKQTGPPGTMMYQNAASVWEMIRNAWNSHHCRFTCDKIYLNLSQDQRERVRGSMATYAPEQMVKAIDKYFAERKEKPGGYEYKSFYLFVEKGMEFYVEV
jgi:hypothetical protein